MVGLFLAKNETIPDSMKENIFRAMAGDERAKALIESNPFLQDLMTRTGNLTKILQRGYATVTNEMVGFPPTTPQEEKNVNKVGEHEKVAATVLAITNRQGGAVYNLDMLRNNSATAQPVIDNALRQAPEAIRRWTSPQYKATFSNDADLMNRTIDHELDVVTRSLRGRMVSMMTQDDSLDNLRVIVNKQPDKYYYGSQYRPREARGGMYTGAGKETVVIEGVNDPYIKSRLIDVYNVVKENKDIWSNFAESPEEYVELLMRRPADWKQPTEVRIKKSEELMNYPEKGGLRPTNPVQLSKEETDAFESFKQQGITPEMLETIYAGLRYKDPKSGEVRKDEPSLMDPANLLGKYAQYYRG